MEKKGMKKTCLSLAITGKPAHVTVAVGMPARVGEGNEETGEADPVTQKICEDSGPP